jgi:hypothetical protein
LACVRRGSSVLTSSGSSWSALSFSKFSLCSSFAVPFCCALAAFVCAFFYAPRFVAVRLPALQSERTLSSTLPTWLMSSISLFVTLFSMTSTEVPLNFCLRWSRTLLKSLGSIKHSKKGSPPLSRAAGERASSERVLPPSAVIIYCNSLRTFS